jgi:hypothetical protein
MIGMAMQLTNRKRRAMQQPALLDIDIAPRAGRVYLYIFPVSKPMAALRLCGIATGTA